MNKRDFSEIKELVQSRLNPREQVLSIYKARKTESIYACIVQDTYNYSVVRLSNHRASRKLNTDTVFTHHNDFWVKSSLSQSLYDNTHWHVFDQESFVALKLMTALNAKGYRLYLHNRLKGKIYMIARARKGEIVLRHYLVNRFQNSLKKLFKTGLLGIYKTQLYPTRAAYDYLELLRGDDYFQKCWHRLEKQLDLEKLQNSRKLSTYKSYDKPPVKVHYYRKNYTNQLTRTTYLAEEKVPSHNKFINLLIKFFTFWKQKKKETQSSISLTPRIIQNSEKKHNKQEKDKKSVNKDKEIIKQTWEKNLAHRSKRKMTNFLTDDALKELQSLKNSLPE